MNDELNAELLDDDNENLAAILARGDSNESNESLGDVPIELRHLEDDVIPSHLDDEEGDSDEEDEPGENTWSAYYKGVMAFFGAATAKSRSLDDIVAAVEGCEKTKNRAPGLREAGRSNTYEDRTDEEAIMDRISAAS